MVDELLEYLLTPTAQITITMGLAEIVKRMGINAKLVPLTNLLLGFICGILVYGIILQYGILKGGVVGTALGLASSGLFSGIRGFKYMANGG